jgi:hypothetical protein
VSWLGNVLFKARGLVEDAMREVLGLDDVVLDGARIQGSKDEGSWIVKWSL